MKQHETLKKDYNMTKETPTKLRQVTYLNVLPIENSTGSVGTS